jgi:hypothetical protein
MSNTISNYDALMILLENVDVKELAVRYCVSHGDVETEVNEDVEWDTCPKCDSITWPDQEAHDTAMLDAYEEH